MALPKMNVPQYKIELPSTGEQINMRPYLVKEEKVLMIALESNDPVQISEAVRNILLDEKSGIGVVLNYPSMEMIANLDMEKLNSSEGMMDIIMESIDSIYDEDNVYDAAVESKEELTSFFDNLSGEQYKKIMNFFRDVPAVYYKSEYDCICGKKNDIELRGLNSFFT